MHYAAHVDYAFASVEHIMRDVPYGDFFDTHTQMEHQCSSLLFTLTFSVDLLWIVPISSCSYLSIRSCYFPCYDGNSLRICTSVRTNEFLRLQ